MDLKLPVSALSRVGQSTAAKLKSLGLVTVEDLLWHLPFRYEDYSKTTPIADLVAGSRVNIIGRLDLINSKRTSTRKVNVTEALIADDSGLIKAVWFNQPFIATTLKVGDKISLSGKVDEDFVGPFLSSPIYEKLSATGGVHTIGLVPNYHLTTGLTQKQLRSLIHQAQPALVNLLDWLPDWVKTEYDLIPLAEALKQIHFPDNIDALNKAKRRLGFDELFILQLESQLGRREASGFTAPSLRFHEEETKAFVNNLPFALTPAQKVAAWEILQDIEKPKPMLRLLEGDVGSGKTLVAMLAMYNAYLNGKQAAIMAPTEILARQHYETFFKFLGSSSLNIGLAVSAERRLSQETDGKKISTAKVAATADIIIGTQALLTDATVFRDLALVVIDEQHRFGVNQRQRLASKYAPNDSQKAPHLLSMTATPIPRTLALALYQDLSLSVIKQSPVGRLPIITKLYSEADRSSAYDILAKEISAGHQVFIVCPLIEDSEINDTKAAKSEEARLKKLFPNWSIGLLHGKLKSKDKERVMAEFASGLIQVLVATAVVEVGIDVPNATVMLIESAERFGLAQLHQYRGRVGRGQHQSYCLLLADDLAENSRRRLECLQRFSSGFDLAKEDLKFRGPGEVYGTLQKGFPELKIASLFDVELMTIAQKAAAKYLLQDPDGKLYPKTWGKLKQIISKSHGE